MILVAPCGVLRTPQERVGYKVGVALAPSAPPLAPAPAPGAVPVVVERLPFIEGVRGLAALLVVGFHTAVLVPGLVYGGAFADANGWQRAAWVLWPAHQAVQLFLVVSAFSLTYSEDVRRLTGRPPTTLGRFWRRRAWRLAPLYYAALLLGWAVLSVVPPEALTAGAPAGMHLQAPVTAGGLVAHLLLLHDLRPEWMFQLNGPLWTIAFEAQLYLVFPLLHRLLRRVRAELVVLPAIGGLELLRLLAPTDIVLGWSVDMGAAFLVGMLIARTYRRPSAVPAGVLAAGGGALYLLALWRPPQIGAGVLCENVFLTAFGLLVLAMARRPRTRWNPLSTRLLRAVGERSYSLYALHFPCLVLVVALGLHLHQDAGSVRHWGAWVVGASAVLVPLVVEAGHRLVERPSMARVRAVR